MQIIIIANTDNINKDNDGDNHAYNDDEDNDGNAGDGDTDNKGLGYARQFRILKYHLHNWHSREPSTANCDSNARN